MATKCIVLCSQKVCLHIVPISEQDRVQRDIKGTLESLSALLSASFYVSIYNAANDNKSNVYDAVHKNAGCVNRLCIHVCARVY